MTFSIFTTKDLPFDRKKVNKIILITRSNKDERKVSALKFELFQMMKKVIVKNIQNHKMLYRNSPVQRECPDDFEVESECYLILDKCIEKYKVTKTNCFYFYFNKSLSRNLYRKFSDSIRLSDRFGEFHAQEIHKSYKEEKYNYDVDFLMTFMDLTWKDKRVLKSKLRKEKKDEFITKNKGLISPNEYQNSIKKIKQEIVIFE